MGRTSNSHIFVISRQTHLYKFHNYSTVLFSRKKDFFSKTSVFDYCVRVDLSYSAQNRKYVHIAHHVSRVSSFSALDRLECDFSESCFRFFLRIFLHQKLSVRPPSFSLILYNHMFEHVYVGTIPPDLENMHHTWRYEKSQFL